MRTLLIVPARGTQLEQGRTQEIQGPRPSSLSLKYQGTNERRASSPSARFQYLYPGNIHSRGSYLSKVMYELFKY